jgi:hypothetical protein
VTVISSERRSTSRRPVDSRYGLLWTTTACLAAAAWIAVAVTQSPLGPLSLFILGLSLYGGMLAAGTPLMSVVTLRRFGIGMLSTAAAALVITGIGHHVVAGLMTVAVLAATWPDLVRRIARRQVQATIAGLPTWCLRRTRGTARQRLRRRDQLPKRSTVCTPRSPRVDACRRWWPCCSARTTWSRGRRSKDQSRGDTRCWASTS